IPRSPASLRVALEVATALICKPWFTLKPSSFISHITVEPVPRPMMEWSCTKSAALRPTFFFISSVFNISKSSDHCTDKRQPFQFFFLDPDYKECKQKQEYCCCYNRKPGI